MTDTDAHDLDRLEKQIDACAGDRIHLSRGTALALIARARNLDTHTQSTNPVADRETGNVSDELCERLEDPGPPEEYLYRSEKDWRLMAEAAQRLRESVAHVQRLLHQETDALVSKLTRLLPLPENQLRDAVARARVYSERDEVTTPAPQAAPHPDDRAVDRYAVIDERLERPWNIHHYRHEYARIRAAATRGVYQRADGSKPATVAPVNIDKHIRARLDAGELVWILEPFPSLADFTDQDLRDTAVTWMALAGATVPEIGAVTGHSQQSVYTILKHYLGRHPELADSAIGKMVAWLDDKGAEL